MADLSKLLAELSPEQRELFLLRLKKKQSPEMKKAKPAKAGRIPPREPGRKDLPLTFGQQRLWFLDRWEPGSSAYNLFGAVRLEGRLDLPALERTFAEIVRRHESLRTTFAVDNGRPRQVISPPGPFALPRIDLSALAAPRARGEAELLVHGHANRPFDLTAGSLLRLTLLRLAGDEHWVLLAMHHIVSDGWSMGVFVRELGAVYAAFRQGAPSPLPPLPIQYADYALWQREWLQGETLAAQLAFWRELLSGAPPQLELPLDRPRVAGQGAPAGNHPLRLSRGLADRLRALALAEGSTAFVVLLAGFAALLSRYAGGDDVVVGSPVANRNRSELEGLIGFFANLLALRLDLAADPTGRELLRSAKRVMSGAQDHQEIPFELLVDELQLARDPALPPLVQVTFAVQRMGAAQAIELPGLRLAPVPAESATAKFDLGWTLSETPEGLAGVAEYNRSLFEPATIARMAGHFEVLLEGLAGEPDRRLSGLPLLTADERRQLLGWNATATAYPRDRSLAGLFAERVAAAPGGTALEFGAESLSYAALDARAGRLARELRRRGVRREVPVGLCAERSPDLIVAILAIVKAGGAYLPLDPGYPRERLAFMLEDSGAPLVLAHERLLGRLPATGTEVLLLDGAAEPGDPADPVDSEEDAAADPADLAYIIYTSGSTGRPKGVAVPHRAVVRLVRGTDYAQLGPRDRVAQVSNTSFDAATFEVWGALLNGGCLVGFSRDLALSPREFTAALRERGITAIFLTSALFSQMAAAVPDGFATLTHLLAGGDAVDPTAARRVLAAGAPRRFVNAYGPTESTTFAVCHLIERVGEADAGIPIGRPIANTTAFVLDRWHRPLPAGVAGELCLGGDGLARGYLGRPGLTAERFIPDPAGGAPGARLYRTGDLVRQRADGVIEFLGRFDHQVKIRGFRVELGEIEAVILRHPAVREAVVLAREDAPGNRRLAAYVAVRDADAADAADAAGLRAFLAPLLPEYMIPAAWVFLDALPLTPNGKVDRRALPAPGRERSPEGGWTAPRDETEARLAAIWAEVLGVERVGVEDDFFDLGGNSILSLQVISRAEAAGLTVQVRQLFEHPTVAELARALGAAPEAAARPAPPIEPLPRDRPLPLSFAQQRLWFIDRLEPGNPAYNVFTGLRLTGRLVVPALHQAVEEVVRRHEALRSTFGLEGGEPVQTVGPAAGLPLPLADLSALPPAARAAESRRLAAWEAARPFDLARGPLLRAALLRLDADEHVALLTMHHIASDGWSMGVLVREVTTLYAAVLAGRPAPLPELAVQYADFAAWQRRWLAGEVLDAEIAYWRERLAGAPPVLELPTDRPRPASRRYRGAARTRLLAADLDALARGEGATLFMVLLAAVQTLLFRLTGQDDVVVGSPVANRNRLEIEPLIGFFVNTLALRTSLAGEPGFRAAVGRVREVTLSAYAHQDLPFERLVEELRPERSLSHSPIFQVMVVLQNAGREQLSLPGLEVEPLGGEQATAKFDLLIAFAESPEGLRMAVEYDADLFLPATAERLLEQLESLLAAAVEDPDRRLGDLPLLTAAARHQVAREWTGAGSIPGAEPLHRSFERQARRAPEAVAAVCNGERLTYGELNAGANRLARWLRRQGVGPESRVGLAADRSLDLVVALLGILKAGGAYVPLDPDYPRERLAFLLADSGVELLLTRADLLADLPADGRVRRVCLEALRPALERESPANLAGGAGPDNLLYVIYTSGSTGRPKGSLLTHRNVARLFAATGEGLGFGERDVWTLFHSFAFDFSVWEIWGALLHGGRLVIVPYWESRSPADFHALLVREGVTVLNQTPSAFRQLAQADGEATEEVRAALALRLVIFGGEALEPASMAPWFERHGDETPRMINMYGITETTVHVTWRQVTRADLAAPARSPIGRAIPDLRLAVLDRWRRPSPIGVPGEMAVGGEGLARGYLGRPDLTAERFVPDPLSALPGERLYRSGDLARLLPDGGLEYLGRIDHQVKIRGFRVELGEIETVLAAHPAVRAAVVLARGDRLAAWVVLAAPAGPPELRRHLAAGLPEYMIPGEWVFLDALPLTSHGKVDRRALLRIEPAAEIAPAGEGEPRTAAEELLAGIWAEVLGVRSVGLDTTFFDLGGHSLLATQVMSRIRAVFGIELPLRSLFERPTVASLAAEIEAAMSAIAGMEGGAEAPPLAPVPRLGALPLSFAQQRLWFLDQMEPGNPAYNLPTAFRLTGELDPAALAEAIREVVRRHEALRTRFEVVAGEPSQAIAPAFPVELPLIDLGGLDAAVRDPEARRLAAEEGARAFDLARGPLLRATLFRLGPDEHLVLAAMHHIVSDGWSMGVFIREVAVLYEAARSGRPSPLPELPVQYADFAAWQRRHLAGEALGRQLAYWRGRLAGAPAVLELPTDRPRPAVRRHLGEQRPWRSSPGLLAGLEAVARKGGATLYMVLLAAFQTLLQRLGGGDDCLVGSPIANRNRAEIEGLIGFFVNTLVLRGDLAGNPTFLELLGRTREAALGAYAHQDLPFEKLVEELRPERSLSHAPLFQVVLTLQNAPVGALELPGLTLTPLAAGTGTAKFDLTLSLGTGPAGLGGSWEYDRDLFDPATVARIAERFAILLAGVAADPAARLADLPLLSGAERHQAIVEWNDVASFFPRDRTLGELFAAQAARTPDATAVVCRGESLTYAALDARADRLARRLRRLGIGPEVPVGLCADRSLDLIAALVAIVKAGGAYVPLDPAYPGERLAYMLESSGAPLVLAEEGTRSALPACSARVLLLEELRDGEESDVPDPPAPRAVPESLAYILYTSGSTGRPKGVAVCHRSVARLVRETNYARLDAGETFLQLAPLAFDPSTLEIWGALLNGGRLVLFPERLPLPEDLEATIRTEGVTTLWLTAGLFHQVVDHRIEGLRPLRQLLAGGEALSPPHVRRVLERFPELRMVNGYGPTEVTTFTTCWRGRELPPSALSVPIGRPIANTRVLVLGTDGRPVPPGVPGELFAGGDGVARGYFGRPDLTAERFVPDPCPPPGETGARLYRTGDRVRYLADGELEFLGRLDGQVKVRGFRIELGEIESALGRHPGVREAAVLVREDAPGDRRIVAYVVGEGGEPTPAVLRAFAAEALPEFMVPAAWVLLDALPLTPNGKVDRRALAALGAGTVDATAGGEYLPPRTPVEEILAGLWAEVLGVDRVGARDDFFERGGHSLLATRLISGVRAALGADLPMRKLFESPILADFAAEVEAARRAGAGPGLPALAPRRRQEGADGEDLPLSFAQERLWFLDRLEPGTAAYNLALPARLTGRLDRGALAGALNELARRHESLRTTFPSPGGQPAQRIAAAAGLPLPEIDLRALPAARRSGELAALLAEESGRPFDLAAGPLARTLLARIADDEHAFLVTQHHIITDGWSMGVLIRELGALYGALVRGEPSPLPEPPLQYADFAAWQRSWLQGEPLARQLAYWQERLAGELPALDLPTDRPRGAARSYRGGSEAIVLGPELSAAVRALTRSAGATLFMTLLAAFAALMHRLSGQDDVLVGSPIAGRNRAEVEGMLGFFINTLVLRSDLAGNPTFRELLARVREEALGAYAHQDLPFEKLVAELHPDRDLARTPLFQVFLNVLNMEMGRIELPGLALEGLAPAEPPSKFDLTVYASEAGDRVQLRLVYNSALFDRARMVETLAQLERLLAAFAADPEARIDDIPLITPAALAALPDPSAPLVAADGLAAVHELFVRRALAAAERIAVIDGDEVWTYGELEARSNRLARRLLASGLQRGEVVAIDARRSAFLAAAVLGTLKAGGAFLLLDPAYPPARRAAYLRLATPRALVRPAGAEPLPAEIEAALSAVAELPLRCRIDGIPDGPNGEDAFAPAVAVGPDDLAYVAFTSGSTGAPKGILGTHGPLSHFLGWHAATFGLGAGDRFSLLSGLAHDPLLRDLFTPLSLGATLCVPAPEVYAEPASLLAWLAGERVSAVHLTPALAQMLAHGAAGALPDLRHAFFGGDRLTGRDVATLRALAPAAACVNFYGATETPQAMGWHAAEMDEEGILPVGRGIDGVQLLVLNRRDRLAGIGELGEICVRTPYLSRGYLGDAALTRERFPVNPFISERFISEPFTGEPGDRLYRTGDLGRYRPDGEVELTGRADAQVKIRGFRIELAEVEAAIAGLPGVQAAAVLVRREGEESDLAAFVVGDLDPASLRAPLLERLPGYMVPAVFQALESLPLTPNGKLDRRALARLAAPRRSATGAAEGLPRTPVEEMLAEIWGELLGRERIGVHDGFFDLGGHSLLATRMVSRVREAFGVELPLRRLFETPTVAGFAPAVEAAMAGGSRPAAPPIAPRPAAGREEAPLSFAQERLWVLDQLEPANPSYNMPSVLRLRGLLEIPLLAASLGEIVRRHEALRTVFHEAGGIPVQVIRAPGPFALPVVDLSALPEGPREAEARRLAAAEAARPFDLARGPLFRAGLLRLVPGDHLLVANMHHIVSDGWSVAIFLAELSALYAAGQAGRPSPLPELAVQYADFAGWQRRWLAGEVLDEQLRYWRQRLAGAPALLELPSDRPRPPLQTFRGARQPWGLPAAAAADLLAAAREARVTPFMLLLAAFQSLLHRYTGADDVVVGSPLAGRTRREVEPLIGFFVNTLVLRTGLAGDPAFGELLGRVRETALGAFAHQDLPFERLVAELRPERHLAHSPVFQVMFTLQNAPAPRLDLPGLDLSPVESPARAARYDWSLSLTAAEAGIGGYLEYNTDLFDPATIRRALGHLATLLGGASADPSRRLSELPLLPAAERRQILAEWNATAEPAWEGPVDELFAAQAARTPEAVAVICRGEPLTYGELGARAGRLASRLRALGVGPETPVALAMERSLAMVVGLLGIWKAGGAYLPLDPAYPRERLAYMLEDSRAPVLVTHRAEGEPFAGDFARGGWTGEVVCLGPGGDLPGQAEEPAAPVVAGTGPDNLAYILYTSGSTGRPKGVQVSHRALANFLGSMRREPGLAPADVFVAVTSLSFDIAGLELWLPLAAGARVVLATRPETADGLLLRALVEEWGGTALQGTPATWRLLIEAGWRGGAGFKALCGGEAFPPALAAELGERAGSVWNLYGPTETTIWSAVAEVRDLAAGAPVPVGRPIDATRIHLLGPHGELVPAGAAGELLIGGAGLARGYLARPDLTAEKFVPDPFAGAPGERLYRTGDLARYRPDGRLECLGRLDSQVKVRGFRIELGEIEAVLARQPAVAQAAVAVRGEGEARGLVAYAVPRAADQPLDAGELRAALRRSLPDYMVPAIVMELAALPLTPNGKVDRRALPAPERRRSQGYAPPRTPAEEILAGVWARVLGLAGEGDGEGARVGIHDNFFDLGGHSVLAIQIVARAREAGLLLTPIQIFQRPTIAELAELATMADAMPSSAEDAEAVFPPAVSDAVDLAAANLSDEELALFLGSFDGGTPSA
ncbi:MAG TPA: non-ribosomal peptide synthase/polyketide synthase [Thermoanaerobaculia bacterium]|jgi:amino acid adenylation domain-containing protein|nr:non-ribosomal peptide synthase/polyketide synthase [Thermoanaerobaculia bacterium]